MDKQSIISWLLVVISTISIVYCLIFPIEDWIVYLVSILAIPFFILGFGLLTMAKAREKDKEERIKEPFTGY